MTYTCTRSTGRAMQPLGVLALRPDGRDGRAIRSSERDAVGATERRAPFAMETISR